MNSKKERIEETDKEILNLPLFQKIKKEKRTVKADLFPDLSIFVKQI